MIEKVDKQTVYSYQYYDKYKKFTKKHLDEALDAYSSYHENLSIINQVAHCYYFLNDYYHGLNFVLKALALPEEAKFKEEYYYSLKLAGDLYSRLGIYESAAEFYIRAMNHIGHDKDRYKRCDLMQSLAYVYFELSSYDMSVDLAVEALQLAELLDENSLIAKANICLCRIHNRRKLYDKALKYGLKVIEIYKLTEDTVGLIRIYFEMASIYEAMKDYSLAKNFYERALLLAEEAFDEHSSIQANFLLGKMLFSEGHIKRAQKILEDTADICRRQSRSEFKSDIYYALADIYEAQGEFELAYNAYKTASELREAKSSEHHKERIYKLHNDYHLSIKDKELRAYMAQNESLEKINKQLAKDVDTDALTELLNRRGMKKSIQSLSSDGSHVLVLCDIDDFKMINDHFGHSCGDSILKEFAKLFQDALVGDYKVARWGGEEFLFILPDCSVHEAVQFSGRLLERIRDKVFLFEEKSIQITMTFGVAKLWENFEKSIEQADRYLYKGKDSGKNIVIYE